MGDIADKKKTVSAEEIPARDVALESKEEEDEDETEDEAGEELRFSPEEEAKLLEEFDLHKAEAKEYYDRKMYQWAMLTYDKAFEACPKYLHFPRAVIKSNIAMCHLAENENEDAIKAATDSLRGLDRVESEDPRFSREKAEKSNKSEQIEKSEKSEKIEKSKKGKKGKKDNKGNKGNKDSKGKEVEVVEAEIISPGARNAAPAPVDIEFETLKANIYRIRMKSLLRRGRALARLTSSRDLEAALEDFKKLAKMQGLAQVDIGFVNLQLQSLPKRIRRAQEAEIAQMWGKMKDLGNGMLKPFGLSTDNFEWTQDEKTGGYSVNMKPSSRPGGSAGGSGGGSGSKRSGGSSSGKPATS